MTNRTHSVLILICLVSINITHCIQLSDFQHHIITYNPHNAAQTDRLINFLKSESDPLATLYDAEHNLEKEYCTQLQALTKQSSIPGAHTLLSHRTTASLALLMITSSAFIVYNSCPSWIQDIKIQNNIKKIVAAVAITSAAAFVGVALLERHITRNMGPLKNYSSNIQALSTAWNNH